MASLPGSLRCPRVPPEHPRAEELKSLHIERGALLGQLTRIKTTLSTDSECKNSDILQLKFDSIAQAFTRTHSAILQIISESDALYDLEEEYGSTAADYIFDIELQLANSLKYQKPTCFKEQEGGVFKYVSVPKLPELKIQQFSGDTLTWPTFRDTFRAIVDSNQGLSPALKFQLLKSHLTGSAFSLLENKPISDDAYLPAWTLLEERYGQPLAIADSLFLRVINLQSINRTASSLDSIYQAVIQLEDGLRALGSEWLTAEVLMTLFVYHKLDPETRFLWDSANQQNVPSYYTFKTFLRNQVTALSRAHSDQRPSCVNKVEISGRPCPKCHNKHPLRRCPSFLALSSKERGLEVVKYGLCTNCLSSDHHVSACESKYRCINCKQKHHSFLHENMGERFVRRIQQSAKENRSSMECVLGTMTYETILGSPDCDNFIPVFALWDSGADSCLITGHLAKKLHLKILPTCTMIKGWGEGKDTSTPAQGKTTIRLQYLVKGKTRELEVKAYIVNRLENGEFNKPIEAIINYETLTHILPDLSDQLRQSLNVESTRSVRFATATRRKRDELYEDLQRFWHWENAEPTVPDALLHPCELLFRETTYRDASGKYVVRIPFFENKPPKPDTFSIAMSRLLSMERRMKRDNGFQERYCDFMREYECLGHMYEAQKTYKLQGLSLLPHHGVARESSTTTKLRVVFDGTSVGKNGISFNSISRKGPTIQRDVSRHLLEFRNYPIALKADIAKMFRQILVAPDQHEYQQILWRQTPSSSLKVFNLGTVTYGTVSAPFLTTRCLLMHAENVKESHPLASAALRNHFYMDDLLIGCESEDEGRNLISELIDAMKLAGMELRKWNSNCKALIMELPNDLQDTDDKLNLISAQGKTLGLRWAMDDDNLRFVFNLSSTPPTTKRAFLKEFSTFFDPLGLISPVILPFKLAFQNLWLSGEDWDVPVSVEVQQFWNKLRNQLQGEPISIPRYVFTKTSFELHIFSDACKTAYGCCAYVAPAECSEMILIFSKTRVASITKPELTTARLELLGMHLAAMCLDILREIPRYQNAVAHLWTDSMVALAWCQQPPGTWKQYVSNRVAYITKRFDLPKIHYIHGEQNPADAASRGLTLEELRNQKKWWNGATITIPPAGSDYYTEQEIQPIKINTIQIKCWCEILDKTLSFERTCNILGTLRYYLHRYFNKEETFSEARSRVEIMIISDSQSNLQKSIGKYKTFIDSTGITRVRTRLDALRGPEPLQNEPIIIPRGLLGNAIIRDAHLQTRHGSLALSLQHIQSKFWILGANRAMRREMQNCSTCARVNARSLQPELGQLPKERIEWSPPFTITGLDYCGPFVHTPRRRPGAPLHVKHWIAVFVCFSTGAVHIEIVCELTTSAFLAAFRRFTARRGVPAHVWSDNATTFQGAGATLQRMPFFQQDQLLEIQRASPQTTEWHFIPAYSPNFGGLWESTVKQLKSGIAKSVGRQVLTLEETLTICVELEGLLNSRPIARSNTTSASSPIALTPNHLLLTRPLVMYANPENPLPSDSVQLRWFLVQDILNTFWKTWERHHISAMADRSVRRQKNEGSVVIVGDVVLVREDTPRTQWPLAIITKLLPGRDGITRVAEIRRSTGNTHQIAVSKLVLLPTNNFVNSQLAGGENVGAN